uniref:Cytotoxin homolog 2 n=1 Tax=Naja melanoleuca TaxID=8643 RepID=3SOF2_NAJME|nr:RecName: Full=Cytotoxin homolog 2; AltName: Full=Cytotoxin homolog V-II-2/V-II-3 [Naja melanoleuca]
IKCHNTLLPFIYKTCPEGQNLCFKGTLKFPKKTTYNRGCAATCPKSSLLVKYVCCNTNKCN